MGQKCSCGSSKLLTWDATHVVTCDQGKSAHARLHTNINKMFLSGIVSSELEARLKPNTVELLNNKFSADFLQKLFNVKGTKKKQISGLMKQASAPNTDKQIAEQGLETIKNIAMDEVQDGSSLRVDGRVSLSRKMELAWDATIIHPLSETYKARARGFFIREAQEEAAAFKEGRVNRFQKRLSSTLEGVVARKLSKYNHLVELRNALYNAHLVGSQLMFSVFAISTLGEISDNVFRFFDFLASRERHAGNRGKDDGSTPSQRAKECKRYMMDKVMVELVKGWGNRLGMVR